MARPLRIEFPGAVYHVTSRGNAGGLIYHTDADRRLFLALLSSVVERFAWVLPAYCLMGNHYHLIVETPEPNLARGMRHLNGVYTQKHNFVHHKAGHLFQGRYKAILIEKDSHLLEVCRYVVLNPVRAGMVRQPRAWKWSSYSATAGFRKRPEFLKDDWVLRRFARRTSEARKAYRAFVREGVGGPSVWEGLVGQLFLGTEEFVARCRMLMGDRASLAEVPSAQRNFGRPSLPELWGSLKPGSRRERNRVIYRAHVEYGYSQKEIADFVGLHYSTVSRAITQTQSKKSRFKT